MTKNKDKVLLMTINPDLLGCTVSIDQVKGLIFIQKDEVCDIGHKDIIYRIKQQARSLGANAVIDIRVIPEAQDKSQVTVYGTAVKFSKDELNGTILKNHDN